MAGVGPQWSKDKTVQQASKSKSSVATNKAEQKNGRDEKIKLLEALLSRKKLTPSNIPKFMKLAVVAAKATKAANEVRGYKEMVELFDHIGDVAENIEKVKDLRELTSEIRTQTTAVIRQPGMTPTMDPLAFIMAMQVIIAFLGALTPMLIKLRKKP